MHPDDSALPARIERFWTWFSAHHSILHRLSQDEIVTAVYDQLVRIDDGLGLLVHVSPPTHELIFTCYGVVQLMQIVRDTAEGAPALVGWSFVAFQPPAEEGFVHRREGVSVDSSAVLFQELSSAQNPRSIGIRLYVPSDVIENEECADIVGCLLQTAAGEWPAMCVSLLDARPLSEAPAEARRLATVGFYIEWKMRQLLEQRNREAN